MEINLAQKVQHKENEQAKSPSASNHTIKDHLHLSEEGIKASHDACGCGECDKCMTPQLREEKAEKKDTLINKNFMKEMKKEVTQGTDKTKGNSCDCGSCDNCLGIESLRPEDEAEDPCECPECKSLEIKKHMKGNHLIGGQERTQIEEVKLQSEVRKLEIQEEELIRHELAHKTAGGGATGMITYTYKKGPDGKMYKAHGEVLMDVSEGNTPEETIRKMQQVQKAAMAPLNPSAADRRSLSIAQAKEVAARRELRKQEEFIKKVNEEVDPGEREKKVTTINVMGLKLNIVS